MLYFSQDKERTTEMKKNDFIVMLIEIVCCVISILPIRVILTIVKNIVKNRKERLDNPQIA